MELSFFEVIRIHSNTKNTQSITADLAEMMNVNRADAALDEVTARLRNMCLKNPLGRSAANALPATRLS